MFNLIKAYVQLTAMNMSRLNKSDKDMIYSSYSNRCLLYIAQYNHAPVESVKTTCMERENTEILGKNKTLFETWKYGKQKTRYYWYYEMLRYM